MSTYGIESFDKIGSGITVSADGNPKQKQGGITIAWAAVPAMAADVTFESFDYVKTGEKYLRYGTVVCRITAATDATEIGKFMPYMATPGGGRTLSTSKGNVFVLNESVHEQDRMSDHGGGAIEGGRIYTSRVLVAGFGDATGLPYTDLFSATTFATACPTFLYVTDALPV